MLRKCAVKSIPLRKCQKLKNVFYPTLDLVKSMGKDSGIVPLLLIYKK